MKRIAILSTIVFLPFSAALAADYQVSRTMEVSAPPQEVWNMIGDFCDIDDWHPAILSCSLKSIDGGIHRILEVDGLGEFVEKLIANDASGLNHTYSIVSSPAPLEGYVGTLSLTRGDPSMLTWSSRFSSDAPEMEAAVGGLYDAGFAAIKAALGE